jgi:hypothetical protein
MRIRILSTELLGRALKIIWLKSVRETVYGVC